MAKVEKTFVDGDAFTAADANTYFMRQVNISVDNQSDRDAILTPQEGMQVWRKDLDGFELYDGSGWNLVPRLLKKVTLATADDLISVTGIPLRDNLRIVIACGATGGNIAQRLRFNNDSGTNYAQTTSYSGGAYGATVSATGLILSPTTAAQAYGCYTDFSISNIANLFKMFSCRVTDNFGSNATTSVNFCDINGKWANNSSQITRVDLDNYTTGDFAVGSYVEIWG